MSAGFSISSAPAWKIQHRLPTAPRSPMALRATENVKSQRKRASMPATAPADGGGVFDWPVETRSISPIAETNTSSPHFPPTPTSVAHFPPTPRSAAYFPPTPRSAAALSGRAPQFPATPRSAAGSRVPVPGSPLVSATFPQNQSAVPVATPLRPTYVTTPLTADSRRARRLSRDASRFPATLAVRIAGTEAPLIESPMEQEFDAAPLSGSIRRRPPAEFDAVPASPAFDAHHASRQIKDIDGYVSFGAIDGLGQPEPDESHSQSGWKGWLSGWKATT